jgi:DNA-binding GntR family transcriptional regulator
MVGSGELMIVGPTLAESVAAALRAGILDGMYLSGERLIELNIAKRMNVSQITVRDALRILEQEGWVIKNPRRGVYVRSFTPEAAEEVYALIRGFESIAMEWVIEKYTRQMGGDLRAILDAARRHAQKDERRAAVDTLFEIHEYFGRVIDRPLTNRILEMLRNQVRMLEAIRQARAPVNAPVLNTMIDLHEQLLKALDQGEVTAARETVDRLFTAYSQLIITVLKV